MFDVLDDLEDAIDKLAAREGSVDVARISKLAERLDCERVRAVGAYDRSGAWEAEKYLSAAAALRDKTRCTPKRLELFQHIERGLVELARDHTYADLDSAVQRYVDQYDGLGKDDDDERELNKVTLSSSFEGRGYLNGSFDPELTELAQTAFDAEMEVLRQKGETRTTSKLRADAFESICRQYLASRGDRDAHGRGQSHVSVIVDIAKYEDAHPDLVEAVRAEFAHGHRLSRTTLERITCDCRISRVIMDGPSSVLDVGWTHRTVTNAQWNALVARDKHCTEPGCTFGPAFCEAHHVWHWEHGGPTNLDNLKLLCWYHHRKQHIHDARARPG